MPTNNCKECYRQGKCTFASQESENQIVKHALCEETYGDRYWCCPTERDGKQAVCSSSYDKCDYFGNLVVLLLGWAIPAMIIGCVFWAFFYYRRRRALNMMKIHNDQAMVHQQQVIANGGIPFAVPAEEYGHYSHVDPPVAQPVSDAEYHQHGGGLPPVAHPVRTPATAASRPGTVSGPSMGATGRVGYS